MSSHQQARGAAMSDNDLRPTAEWALGRPARSMRYLAEPMSRAIWAEQERDEAEARAEAAEQQAARLRAALTEADEALVSVINYRDAHGVHPLDGPITIAVDRAISRSRAALAAIQPAPAVETICRCGRPLINPGDDDPWCEGCTMSAKTCDCVSARV